MALATYRCRWFDSAGIAIVEKRHEQHVLGIWPVYVWEGVAHFRTVADGLKWIVDTKGGTEAPSEQKEGKNEQQ